MARTPQLQTELRPKLSSPSPRPCRHHTSDFSDERARLDMAILRQREKLARARDLLEWLEKVREGIDEHRND